MGECAGIFWQGGGESTEIGVFSETVRRGLQFQAGRRVGSEEKKAVIENVGLPRLMKAFPGRLRCPAAAGGNGDPRKVWEQGRNRIQVTFKEGSSVWWLRSTSKG